MTAATILIAYDGSDDAKAAIDAAAGLFPGADAVVLYARQPLEAMAAHLEGHPALEAVSEIDGVTLDTSQQVAEDGATYARSTGLQARAQVAAAFETPAEAIVETADALDAALIVLGSRGRRGMRAALLGSTSTHVLHHARRPTLVIPSPQVVAVRSDRSVAS